MQSFTSAAEVPEGFGPSAVTIGKFDGLHAGHRRILQRLDELAAERGLVPTVVTFDRNPLRVIAPERCPDDLVSPAQKRELLEAAGVGAVLMLSFDSALSSLPPERFVREILVDALHARVLLVGRDFRFGARGAGDLALLRRMGEELGFDVELQPDVALAGERRASSTWVRELLAHGDIRGAAELLGRNPVVRSVVVHGEQRGRELGYPTANLGPAELEGFIPADGVYAAWLTVDGVRYPAAVSIGNNPTFEGVPARQVEAHALDQDFDIYGARVEVEFVDRLRGMERFDSLDALITQMDADTARTRAVLGDQGSGRP
ncbi:bifunctional riboflavin kinase/FAD synthetase [Desertivibrio insolitus]|uniref:bifunctional riboflavin kinase/FAD synthetase n=1 Tax=Herbiconiux sp. SYSU D00978 TaxID=2812562 RepID=UPI001A96D564|nr:bifunctional riboflavin kinase/FAD synthetase [Herbiconiux sp. SYSU D00978]